MAMRGATRSRRSISGPSAPTTLWFPGATCAARRSRSRCHRRRPAMIQSQRGNRTTEPTHSHWGARRVMS
ncbi:ubiquitin carboxyl-terminal hydrolase 2-like isoform X1 [Iris pallida]|uniref:Ubiquitin carboxyl-terminal hydrolase 2-like isoform X1 n=1 Tax=Iris pallida TaxID=29817 RepID=A0AAX6H6N3_IRIPA|nr:ubiquitin carboxyl-terminal hydrolase 2-like isoform X1 [Iris pallida]